MDTRFEWSKNKSKIFSEIFDFTSIDRKNFKQLFDFSSEYLEPFKKLTTIEIVSTTRQSSFITHRRNESAIFFDLCQTITIRAIYHAIASGLDYRSVADILRQSGAMYISKIDNNYAHLLGTISIIGSNDHYVEPKDVLYNYQKVLYNYHSVFSDGILPLIYDSFVMGHEIFHLLNDKQVFFFDLDIKKISNDIYELALV